jgi:hypothetical protein
MIHGSRCVVLPFRAVRLPGAASGTRVCSSRSATGVIEDTARVRGRIDGLQWAISSKSDRTRLFRLLRRGRDLGPQGACTGHALHQSGPTQGTGQRECADHSPRRARAHGAVVVEPAGSWLRLLATSMCCRPPMRRNPSADATTPTDHSVRATLPPFAAAEARIWEAVSREHMSPGMPAS